MITETKGKERVGQVIGRYRLERYASGDAVSNLYLAYDVDNADPVTLQIFSKAFPPRSDILAAFRQAQRSAQELRHPAVARVVDVGVTEAGELFVVMNFIIRTTLRSYVDQLEEPLSVEEALSVTAALGEGLAAALQMGLLHNDLRPGNVAISTEGRPVLLGLNTPLPEEEPSRWLPYRSPEQREGKVLDARSNVYSLGAILYELLLGLTPPEDPSRPLKLLRTTYKELPDAIHHVLQTSLARENWARFQTMRQMLAALEDAMSQGVSLSGVDGAETIPFLPRGRRRAPVEPNRRWVSRLLSLLLIILFLAACGLLLSSIWPIPQFVQSLLPASQVTEEPVSSGLGQTETPGAEAGVVLSTETTAEPDIEEEATPTMVMTPTQALATSDATATAAATPTAAPSATPEPALIATPTLAASPTVAPTATEVPPEPGVVRARRWAAPPTIDGDLAEWADVAPVRSEFVVFSRSDWNGVEDSMAWWRLAWDDAYLYVGVDVVDDVHVQDDTGSAVFLGDSLEMQFDTTLDSPRATVLSEGNFQIMLSPGDFETLPPEAFRFRGTNSGDLVAAEGNNVTVAAIKTEAGYGLEAAIPWSDLDVTPAAGMRMGLALNANDNDVAGASIQEVMISNVPERTLYDPSSWGLLILE